MLFKFSFGMIINIEMKRRRLGKCGLKRRAPARACTFVEITGIADITCFIDGYEYSSKLLESHIGAGTMCATWERRRKKAGLPSELYMIGTITNIAADGLSVCSKHICIGACLFII